MASGLTAKTIKLVLLLSFTLPALGQGSTETLLPTNLNFGYGSFGSQSASQAVTLKNTGTGATTLSSIETSGDFVQTNNCPTSPATLAPGANCTINVAFWPAAEGNRSGNLTVTDDAVGNPHVISLNGIGVGPAYVWGRDTWMVPGTSHLLRVLGTEDLLLAGDTPTVAAFPGPVQVNYVVVGSTRDLNISVTVPDGTPSGYQDLIITDGTLSHTIANALRVVDGTVLNPSPSVVELGSSTTLSIAANPLFQGQSSFSLDLGPDVAVGPITLQPDGTLKAPISVTPWAMPGTRSVHLTAGPYAFLAERGFAIDFGPLVNQLTLNSQTVSLPAGYSASVIATQNAANGLNGTAELCVDPQNYAYVMNQAVGPSPPNSFSLSVFNLNAGSFGAFVRYLPNLDVSGKGGLLENCTFLPSAPGILYLSTENYPPDFVGGQTITGVDTATGSASLFYYSPDSNLDPLGTTLDGNMAVGVIMPPPTNGGVSVLDPAGNLIKSCPTFGGPDDIQVDPLTGKVVANESDALNQIGYQTLDLRDCSTTRRSNGPVYRFDEGDFAPAAGNFGNQLFTGMEGNLNQVQTFVPVSYTDPDQSTPERYVTFADGLGFTDTARFDREGQYLLIADSSWHQAIDAIYRIPGYQPPLPVASLSAQQLDFSSQEVGTTSAVQTLTMTNLGDAPLTLANITARGDFVLDPSTTCTISSPVKPGANCIIGITFTPTDAGNRSGAIIITNSANAAPQMVALTGTGATPAVSLSPSTVTFGSQAVGTTTPAQSVTLTNTGSSNLNITTLTPSGDFALAPATTCSTSVPIAPSGTCTIAVTFTPTATGTQTGAVALNDNASDSPQSLPLSGTGTQAGVDISPNSITFPDQIIGTSSSIATLTLTNLGLGTLGITSITVTGTNSGDFSQSNTCGNSVPAGGKCTISVTFHPTASGMRAAAITIADNYPNSPQLVSIAGAGVASVISGAPSSLTFGGQVVGTTSVARILTVVNTGTGPLIFSGETLSGDFAFDGSMLVCSTLNHVPVGMSCTIGVTFTPTTTGVRTGTLTIYDNSGAGSQTFALSGTGVPPGVSLAPASLMFGSQVVGTTSATQWVTLTNTGTSDLNFTSLNAGGNFSVPATTCSVSAPLAPNGACTIGVTFTPTAPGIQTGAVTIDDDGGGGQHEIALIGTGTVPGVTLTPADLTFPLQLAGTTSAAQSVTVANTGTESLTITSLNLTGKFAFDPGTTCSPSTPIAPGGACTIAVTFQPQADTPAAGQVTITDNATGGVHTIALAGTGTAAAISLSRTSVTFPVQGVGTTSLPQGIYLTSVGARPLSIYGFRISGDFSIDASSSTCAPNTLLAPSTNCLLVVNFTPAVAGTLAGNLTISDNASGGSQTISLSGTSMTTGVYLSPPTLTFGSQVVGTMSVTQSVQMYNSGLVDLTIQGLAVSGDFTVDPSTTCVASFVLKTSSAPCTISVTFKPTAAGTRIGIVAISDSAPGSPQTISLYGTGIAPGVSLTSSSLTFGSQVVGTTSAAQIVTLTNSGTAALTFTGFAASNDFALDASTTTCSSANSLAVGSSCTLGVTFTPAATGTRTGELTISDSASSGTQVIALSGTGTAPGVLLSSSNLAFGSQVVGTTSAAQIVTLTNSGTAVLSFSGFTTYGDYARDANNTTCSTAHALAVGSSCTFGVTFTPAATGTRAGAVTINDNASGGTQVVSLSGTGTAPGVSLAPSSLTFGSTVLGTTSAKQSVVLTNTGTSNLIITTRSVSGDYALDPSTTCAVSAPIAPSGTCTIAVKFTPAALGTRTGAMTINDNASGGTQVVSLSGTGTAPGVSLAPSSLNFGDQGAGTTSSAQMITVTNNGNAPLTFASIISSGDFAVTNDCLLSSVAVGGTCTIHVTFTPTVTGSRTGVLTLSDNALNSPQTVTLLGNGVVTYSISSSSSSASVISGADSTTFVISASAGSGSAGGISLSCSGNAPASCIFNPPSISTGQSSTLTLGGLAGISPGTTLTFNVIGANGGQSASLPLSVSIADFSLAPMTTSAIVTAGNTAKYTINIVPLGGFNQAVNLSCSGTPRASTCTASPGSVTLDGRNSTAVIINMSTAARSMMGRPNVPAPPKSLPGLTATPLWLFGLLAFLLFVLLASGTACTRWGGSSARGIPTGSWVGNQRATQLVLAGLLVALLTWASCGGAGGTTPTSPTGTPPGTYEITVRGTFNGSTGVLTHTIILNLTVN